MIIKVGNIFIEQSLIKGISEIWILQCTDIQKIHTYGNVQMSFELYTQYYLIAVKSVWYKTPNSNFPNDQEIREDTARMEQFNNSYWNVRKSLEANGEIL